MKKLPFLLASLLVIPAVYASSSFSDVPNNEWYEDSVSHLAAEDVIEGYADGTFKPGQSVNRAELAVILDRYEDMLQENMEDYFEAKVQKVISNTLSFASNDYDFSSFLVMAESGLKLLDEKPSNLQLNEEAHLPEGYEIFVDDNSEAYDYYLHYEGSRIDGDVEYQVDQWYGPFAY